MLGEDKGETRTTVEGNGDISGTMALFDPKSSRLAFPELVLDGDARTRVSATEAEHRLARFSYSHCFSPPEVVKSPHEPLEEKLRALLQRNLHSRTRERQEVCSQICMNCP